MSIRRNGLKKSPLKRISKKKARKIREEDKLKEQMLIEHEGCCAICGDYAPLMKSHTRDRKHFAMCCYACHFPENKHHYLDDVPGWRDDGYRTED